jgi:tetratricopeptide (TPR) repeat protein
VSHPLAVALLVSVAAQPQSDTGCTARQIDALRSGAALIARGDDAAAHKVLMQDDPQAADACVLIRLARLAIRGWEEARQLAAVGGSVDSQAPTRAALAAIEALRGRQLDLEIEYAQTAIRAAIAAAQDERSELSLLLDHARDVTERLIARQRRPIWPRSFNVVAGELWLEVDRYDEARAAFERAAQAERSAIAVIGMARALARLGRVTEACAAFRTVREASSRLREMARQDLARCR